MGKFQYTFVPDREYESQFDYDWDVLNAGIVEMSNQITQIFSGLDGVLKAYNEAAQVLKNEASANSDAL